jgi:hypothetical protein
MVHSAVREEHWKDSSSWTGIPQLRHDGCDLGLRATAMEVIESMAVPYPSHRDPVSIASFGEQALEAAGLHGHESGAVAMNGGMALGRRRVERRSRLERRRRGRGASR